MPSIVSYMRISPGVLLHLLLQPRAVSNPLPLLPPSHHHVLVVGVVVGRGHIDVDEVVVVIYRDALRVAGDQN